MHALVKKSSFSKAQGLHETSPRCLIFRRWAVVNSGKTWLFIHLHQACSHCMKKASYDDVVKHSRQMQQTQLAYHLPRKYKYLVAERHCLINSLVRTPTYCSPCWLQCELCTSARKPTRSYYSRNVPRAIRLACPTNSLRHDSWQLMEMRIQGTKLDEQKKASYSNYLLAPLCCTSKGNISVNMGII